MPLHGNTDIFPIHQEISAEDILFGLDKINNKSKNFRVGSLISYLESQVAIPNFKYYWSDTQSAESSIGIFNTNDNDDDVNTVTQLVFNKVTADNLNLQSFFDLITNNRTDVIVTLRNQESFDNIIIFRIDSFQEFTDYYTLNIVKRAEFSQGTLQQTVPYIISFNIFNNLVLDTSQFSGETLTSNDDTPQSAFETLDQKINNIETNLGTQINHTHTKAEITDFNDADYATAQQGSNADEAHSWGNHADVGYLTEETDPAFTASEASNFVEGDKAKLDSAVQPDEVAAIVNQTTLDLVEEINTNIENNTTSITDLENNKADINHTHTKADITDFNDADYATAAQGTKADSALQPGQVLDGTQIRSDLLPSYVDDVLEGTFVDASTFNDETGNAYTGEKGKIYLDTTTNKTYRFSGSIYVELISQITSTKQILNEGATGVSTYVEAAELPAIITPLIPTDNVKTVNNIGPDANGNVDIDLNSTEEEVSLVNNYENIKKIEKVQTNEGGVYVDYSGGYIYISNYDGDLDTNSLLGELEQGDVIYIEGVDGSFATLTLSDYTYSEISNTTGELMFEAGALSPLDYVDSNGNQISETDTNFSDSTYTTKFNVWVESVTESEATTVADALSFVESELTPYTDGNLINVGQDKKVNLGGVATGETNLDLRQERLFFQSVRSDGTEYESEISNTRWSLEAAFHRIKAFNATYPVGAELTISTTSILAKTSINNWLWLSEDGLKINTNGTDPELGQVLVVTDIQGKCEWQTLPSSGGAETDGELDVEQDIDYTTIYPFYYLEEELVATDVRVNFSGGQIETDPTDAQAIIDQINRPEDEILTARFVNKTTGAVGYADFYISFYEDQTGTINDYLYLVNGGSYTSKYSYSYGNGSNFVDENGNPITDLSNLPDDDDYEMYVFVRKSRNPQNQKELNIAERDYLIENSLLTKELSKSVESDLNGNTFLLRDFLNAATLGTNNVFSVNYFSTTLNSVNFLLRATSLAQISAPSIMLNGGSERGLVIPRLTAPPSAPIPGSMYYDTQFNEYRKYDEGSATWIAF